MTIKYYSVRYNFKLIKDITSHFIERLIQNYVKQDGSVKIEF